ncbi:MAG: T9SS type A sorting domain-containing protein [Flavipsychrobacter sp.]|nr:T9SS type A sorting domain-containing protein [Flavipsychrobacter sp.]
MKSKLNSRLFLLAFALPALAQAQTANEFRSAVGSAAPTATPASGNWTTAANWQKYDATVTNSWIAAPGNPGTTATALTTVLNGSAMTLSASSGANTLMVENGGSIKWGSGTAAQGLRISGTTLTNNGLIGGAPVDDSINLEVSGSGLTYTLTGSGTTIVNRLRAYYGLVGTTIVLDMPVTFTNQSASLGSAVGLTGYYSSSTGSTTGENITVTINPGKTISFVNYATLHYASKYYANVGGAYTYNVNGTANMWNSKGTTFFSANANTSTSVTTLNVSGLLITPAVWSSIDSLSPSQTTPGTVHMNILAGGMVDATQTDFKLDDSTTFVMADGTAMMKRFVGPQDTTYPISTSYKGNNTVVLHNAGTADTFAVSLQNFNIPAVTSDLTTVVNREWKIKEAGTGGKLDSVKLTWLAAEAGSAIGATPSVYVRPTAGTTQIEYVSGTNVTVTGSGTLASPYVATVGVAAGAPAGTYFVGKPGLPTAVANVANGGLNITVAPNPTTNKQINFQISGNKAGTYKVAVINMAGQVVYRNEVNYNANTTNYKVNMSNMPTGVYQLQISNGQTNIGNRVVVE